MAGLPRVVGHSRHGPYVSRTKPGTAYIPGMGQEMDHNHPQFLDGLNMDNDYFDLSSPGPMETAVGPSGSGATPTSRAPKPKKHTSNVWQCFDVVQKTMPDGQLMDRA
ncbi:hypothetical protein LWI29_012278 [Acer saccharum]|uniref:Uncharacterized protein n=1 Tax=Acer saccharum TaxID=4024 RepID=A0AA39RIX5_ACESA|nr:hypothetical protein LWI29_012278 [Acer saccharum]